MSRHSGWDFVAVESRKLGRLEIMSNENVHCNDIIGDE